MAGLAARSGDRRESGAIWAGNLHRTEAFASDVFFHHELCDDRGTALSLQLTEDAKFALYTELATRGLKLVGMIHTHPQDWVGLSAVDEANQLCSRIGFWSLVAPWYGRPPWELTTLGVHARAETGWYRLEAEEVRLRVVLA
jgi:hypothetical protein